MERRQREEAEALEEYKKAKKKEAEREKKKLEKLKQQGKDKEYKEKMAQAKRKRKYDSEEESSEEDDDEDDYKVLFLTLASFLAFFSVHLLFLSVCEACSRFYFSLFFVRQSIPKKSYNLHFTYNPATYIFFIILQLTFLQLLNFSNTR